jgi:hypothetical protein
MTGTEKQIKWAEDIKASAIEAFDIMENNAQRPYFNEYSLEAVKAIRAFVEPQILAMEDAAVIIKSRARLTQRAFEERARMYDHTNK